jgi:hypothetical protein
MASGSSESTIVMMKNVRFRSAAATHAAQASADEGSSSAANAASPRFTGRPASR